MADINAMLTALRGAPSTQQQTDIPQASLIVKALMDGNTQPTVTQVGDFQGNLPAEGTPERDAWDKQWTDIYFPGKMGGKTPEEFVGAQPDSVQGVFDPLSGGTFLRQKEVPKPSIQDLIS